MESLWKLFCFATLFFAGGFVLQPAHARMSIGIVLFQGFKKICMILQKTA